ncbi:MAG: hypothetical protein ABIO70_25930, partial [Pseudomonadota bacterium]
MHRLLLVPVLLALVGCRAQTSFHTMGADDTAAEGASDWDADADSDADSDSDTDYGSETEDDFLMLAPATTDAYVFIANPERDT